MKNDILKNLAMKAKNRLINKNLRNTYSNIDIKIINENDEAFYKKVKEIVNEKEFVYNPIKRLMDENKMMNMTPNERERYLLQTIEKYQDARRKIFKEQCSKIV